MNKSPAAYYHVGVIPDGNRRWAHQHNLHPSEGHKMGAKKGRLFVDWAFAKPEIKEISMYGLSEENFKRSEDELDRLCDIYFEIGNSLLDEKVLHEKEVRVNFISTKPEKLPNNIIEVFDEVKSETKFYGNKILNILIGYTGQNEILRAVSSPMNRVKNLFFGLNENDLERNLGVKNSCDLIIRSGEEEKEREAKSGFLLWQSAYSEYYHINKFWPDVGIRDFNMAWNYFLSMRRLKGQ